MPTALQLVSRSMRLIGALGSGETLTADEQTDGIDALNSMLDTWGVQSNSVYMVQRESFTWAANQASQTIGSGGDFNTTRPVRIVGAWQTLSDIDYPIELVSESQQARIADKTTTSTIIEWIYPDYDHPTITLYAWPVPDTSVTVVIRSHKALQSFSAATTDLAMPEGYEDAIAFNLALRLAPEYKRTPSEDVRQTARTSLRTIKTRNIRMPNAINEAAYISPGRRTAFSIYRGD